MSDCPVCVGVEGYDVHTCGLSAPDQERGEFYAESDINRIKAEAVREAKRYIMMGLLSRHVAGHEFEEYADKLERGDT